MSERQSVGLSEASFQDELDKKSIDQLHQVVIQFGNNCFEAKKLCVTVLVSASVLITSFTNKQLDLAFFVAGAFVTLFFWFLDGYNYFYQEKLRSRMKELAEGIARRNNPPKILGEANQLQINVDGVGMPLSEERERSNRRKRVIRSAFNYSMLFYMLLVFLNIVIGLIYHFGLIHSTLAN
jgi:hypothetical protein